MNLKIGLFVTSLERDYNKTPASYWIRILQMMAYYRDAGARVYLNNYFKPVDVAIVFRKPKRKYYYIIKYLKIISKSVYFDTCINIFNLHEEIGPDRLTYAKLIANTVDGIICASHRIAEYTRPFARSVYVMEDPVDLRHFNGIKQHVNFDSPVFGWSGVGLKSIYLNRFANEVSGRMLIISEPGIHQVTLNFKYEFIRWDFHTFPADILACDIALLPRDYNDPYNDSHSSFKALIFAIHGIPVLASRVPSYVEMSKYYDGIVFLEDHDNDLHACTKALRSKSLNTTRLRQHYSCENQASGLLSYLEAGLAGK